MLTRELSPFQYKNGSIRNQELGILSKILSELEPISIPIHYVS